MGLLPYGAACLILDTLGVVLLYQMKNKKVASKQWFSGTLDQWPGFDQSPSNGGVTVTKRTYRISFARANLFPCCTRCLQLTPPTVSGLSAVSPLRCLTRTAGNFALCLSLCHLSWLHQPWPVHELIKEYFTADMQVFAQNSTNDC